MKDKMYISHFYGTHMHTGRVLALVATLGVIGCSGSSDGVIEASGTIEGTDVNIASQVTGTIDRLFVDEGSRVKAGDTLVTIDDTEYRLQLQQAIAMEEGAEAQYRLALEGARKEDVLQAEANFKSAEADYLRMKELLASQTVTQKQYDDAYARYVSAQQTYEKLFRGLRKDEITAARAKRDQAAAQTALLRKKVHDCNVVSPSDGVVTLKAVEPGELVAVGGNLLRVTYLDRVNLMIYVPETSLGHVKLGQAAKVSIDTYPDKSFEGNVVYISPAAEFTPKNVQTKEERSKLVFGVKISIDNPQQELKPGLPADARLEAQGS